MDIATIPLDPCSLRTVPLTVERETRQATGLRPVDTWRTPVRDSATGRFVPFRWFA